MAQEPDATYTVIVCDLFHAHEPDHESEVGGFATPEAAVEYARRRTRSSVEQMRLPGQAADELRERWRSFGEECRAVGPDGPLYVGSSELDAFVARPARPEEIDWLGQRPAAVETALDKAVPPDFALTYHWAAASVPPPWHYEYDFHVSAAGEGEVVLWPGYPEDGLAAARERFVVGAGQLAGVWAAARRAQMFTTPWRGRAEPSVGGQTEWLTVEAGGERVDVPPDLPDDQAEAMGALYAAVRGLVPTGLLEALRARTSS